MEKDDLQKEREESSIASGELRQTQNFIEWEKEKFEKGNLLAAYTLGAIYQKETEEIGKDLEQSAFWFKIFAEAPYRPEQEDIWILSIDGGGIRGLIPVTILEMLEKDLLRKFGLDIYIADLLKIVAGTSTGSIIALGLTIPDPYDSFKPRYHAEKLSNFYTEEGKLVFPPTYWIIEVLRKLKQATQPKFSPQALKEALTRRFEKSKFSETLNGIQALIPTYQLQADRPYIFDNKKSPDNRRLMQEIVQASSAAPTYFPAVSIAGEDYVDGGIGLNNPSLKSYQQARLSYPEHKIILVSLGTGITRQPLPGYLTEGGALESTEGGIMSSFFSSLQHHSLSATQLPKLHEGWVAYAPNIMMRETAESVHEALSLIQTLDPHFEYFRFQPEIHKVEMDDTKEIPYLREMAEEFYASDEKVKELREKLEALYFYQAEILKKKLSLLNQVSKISLEGIRLTPSHIQQFCQGLAAPSTLTELHLQRTGLTPGTLQALCQVLTHNKSIITLNLAENGIRKKGTEFLAKMLDTNTTLLNLNLRHNGIDESDREVLRYLLKQKTLKEKYSLLEGGEKEQYSFYTVPTSLRELDLSENKIGPQGLKHLVEDLKDLINANSQASLTVLLLSNNTWQYKSQPEALAFKRVKRELKGVSKQLNFHVAF